MSVQTGIWAVSAAVIAGIVLRPFRVPEWVWAIAGAIVLVAAGLLPAHRALGAVTDGLGVYLFLAGMLALAELGRAEGVFDWLSGFLLRSARGSRLRLFALIYGCGVVITALLSNDATVLLLTPAIFATLRRTDADPLPSLYACAFVANAASFVLPISNPANLVVFRKLPALAPWVGIFGLSALAAIVLTGLAAAVYFRQGLRGGFSANDGAPGLSPSGRVALAAMATAAALIVAASALGYPVGVAAFVLGGAATVAVALSDAGAPRAILRHGPWGIIPLVAGLFVMVQALDASGVLNLARRFFTHAGQLSGPAGSLLTAGVVSLADNVLNNLPAGLIVRHGLHGGVPAHVAHAALIGVDLGPNLTVAGSLATIIWLMSLRRDGVHVTYGGFLLAGVCVLVPALEAAALLVQ